MGTSALRQLLMSFCHNLQWNYAVFWKLKHGCRMFLTWEDGYCDYPKRREPVESISDYYCYNNTDGIISFDCETSACHEGSEEYSIGLTVANMSCLLYAFGEGVVGKVASTGNYCWVFADKFDAGEFNTIFVPEYSDEWLLQFAAGIKTILFVPVVPHGVVQLGSLETVAEDPTLVAYIKDMFNTLQYVPGASIPFASSKDSPSPSQSSLTSLLLENLAETSAITDNQLHPYPLENPIALDGVQIAKNKLSNSTSLLEPLFMVQDYLQGPVKDLQAILKSAKEAEFDALSEDPTEVSLFPSHSTNAIADTTFSFGCLEENAEAFSQCNGTNKGVFDEYTNKNLDCYSSVDMMGPPFGDGVSNETDHKIVRDILSFPMDSELHKALGPAFLKGFNRYLSDPVATSEGVCRSSSLICHRGSIGSTEPSVGESNSLFVKGVDAGHLLDAVVTNVCTAAYDAGSNRSNSVGSPTTSSGQFAAASQTKSQSESTLLVGEDSVPRRYERPPFVTRGRIFPDESSTGASSFKSMARTLIDEEQQKKGFRYGKPKRITNPTHASKKRAIPNNSQRPRPRDRQMIQDRVKELRELVPNGGKCSIDALLDRTIKHMSFLRSVSNQAEKLRQCMHPKLIGKNWRPSFIQGHQNGASWAFELGSQPGRCPIVVEDLDHAGHILIEMLCEEHGLFLEIAQVIRHLEFTILKGVMEGRSEKMWAHFIVEAPRGFQRMDIFWPLMKLLQRNGSSNPC